MHYSDYARTAKNWSHTDPLPRHQWLYETPVVIIEENELPQWKSPEQILQAVRDMGASHVRYPAVSWGAHFYGKSKMLPKFTELPEYKKVTDAGFAADFDLFGDVSRCMKENGVKVMAYMHFGGVLYEGIAALHPDWRAVQTDGSYYIWNKMHYMACLSNDEFAASMLCAIEEVLENYAPDSIYLDGPIWYTMNCQCASCRRKYKEKYGVEQPLELSYKDGTMQKYHKFREEIFNDIMDRAHAITQKYGVPLQINTHMKQSESRTVGHIAEAMSRCEGANTTEVHRNLRFWPILESIKLGESTKAVSMAYCPPGPYESFTTYSIPETEILGLSSAVHHGTPMMEPGVAFFFDNSGSEAMKRLSEKIEANKEIFYRTQPVKELALVQNHHYSPALSAEYQYACFSGMFEALCHSHRHFDCMLDAQLSPERLAGYKAVIIPSMPEPDDYQSASLRTYVEGGGTLVVGQSFSLYRNTEQLENFALADLLGVDFIAKNDVSKQHTREYRESALIHPFADIPEAYVKPVCKLPGFPEGRMVITTDAVVGGIGSRVVHYTRAEPREGVETLASLYLPAGGTFGSPFTFPEGEPPAITVHPVGKGRVIWCASDLWERYLRRHMPDQRKLLCALADFAVGTTPLADADAPAGVYVYMTENAEGRYLQILNYCGSMLECPAPVEEILPVYDVTFRVRADRECREIRTLSGAPVSVSRSGDVYELKLPRLDLHEGICLIY